jgi:hypothetical protein
MDRSRKLNLFNKISFLSVLVLSLTTSCDFSPGTSSTKSSGVTTLDTTAVLAGPEPVFVSDYFSFVGADGKGHVAFAIDNDRSRRNNKFDADAHVFLHDEREGWIKVSGNGAYENRKRELLRIPDSPAFQFSGEVKSGITLHSPRNRLKLVIGPMQERFSRVTSDSVFSMGSTSAALSWKDRVIPGRVTYECIFMVNMSPWYSYVSGLFYNDFQGLYLETIDQGDLYLRNEKGKASFGNALGFLVLDQKSEVLEDLRTEIPERSLAFGFYRWPSTWQVSWLGSKGHGSLSVTVVDRKNVTNWVIGGFAMAVVSGELTYDGKTRPVYGLAELIR